MGQEIERKFLTNSNAWKSLASGVLYRQGYIGTQAGHTVRVRIAGEMGFLTLKTKTVGICRSEYEYPIPLSDAAELLDQLCDRPLIEKYRYRVPIGDVIWEVDEFLGDNQGLTVAEVELESEDQFVALPDWIGAEVSGDARYYNSNLARVPFSQWERGGSHPKSSES
jgi:adenylate cyclase